MICVESVEEGVADCRVPTAMAQWLDSHTVLSMESMLYLWKGWDVIGVVDGEFISIECSKSIRTHALSWVKPR